jgi:hypothetical protein
MDAMDLASFNQALTLAQKRAATDPAFRARFLATPDEAFREATGQEVPAGLRLRCVEAAPGEIVLPLPEPVQGFRVRRLPTA